MIDTPTGPRFTDDAPLLTGGDRSTLVAAMVERWHRVRTPGAPRDVAQAEALAFLADMFEPPPVAA